MAEIKEFRLGGAGGYSLHAFGSKTRSGVVYERIELRFESEVFGFTRDVSKGPIPPFMRASDEDYQHLFVILTEARKHLAMGSV